MSYAQAAGKECIEKALLLYFIASDSETPAWAKAAIYGALGYFILPIDAIPDVIPIAGFTDDLGALVACCYTVACCTKEHHKQQAAQKVRDWFG